MVIHNINLTKVLTHIYYPNKLEPKQIKKQTLLYIWHTLGNLTHILLPSFSNSLINSLLTDKDTTPLNPAIIKIAWTCNISSAYLQWIQQAVVATIPPLYHLIEGGIAKKMTTPEQDDVPR